VRKEHFDIYCGRSFMEFPESEWHNPFRVEPGCGRKCVIQKFRAYLLARADLMAKLHELKGKILGCWCKPKDCHCDVIAELVNGLKTGPRFAGPASLDFLSEISG
jgi:hypothetical protein